MRHYVEPVAEIREPRREGPTTRVIAPQGVEFGARDVTGSEISTFVNIPTVGSYHLVVLQRILHFGLEPYEQLDAISSQGRATRSMIIFEDFRQPRFIWDDTRCYRDGMQQSNRAIET